MQPRWVQTADHDQPFGLAGLDARGVGGRIAQRGVVVGDGRGDLLGRAVAHEQRLLALEHRHLLAERHLGDVVLDRGQRQGVGRRVHLVDQRPGDRGDAARGGGDGGDVDEVAPAGVRRVVGDRRSRRLRYRPPSAHLAPTAPAPSGDGRPLQTSTPIRRRNGARARAGMRAMAPAADAAVELRDDRRPRPSKLLLAVPLECVLRFFNMPFRNSRSAPAPDRPMTTPVNSLGPEIQDRRARAKAWFESLQQRICAELERLEDEAPAELYPERARPVRPAPLDARDRRRRRHRRLPDRAPVREGRRPHLGRDGALLAGDGQDHAGRATSIPTYVSASISLIVHPRSPRVPTVHMNTRFLSTAESWFGGGADLTPMIDEQRSQERRRRRGLPRRHAGRLRSPSTRRTTQRFKAGATSTSTCRTARSRAASAASSTTS